MKKIVLLFTVLFISVLTTACINNFAVQELNSKAKVYMNSGDVDKAICRLKSSLDLDNTLYETHYNLAVAYIAKKDYSDAIESLNNTLKLKPDFIDAYYLLGVSYEESAYEIINHEIKDKEDDKNIEESDSVLGQQKPLSADEKSKVFDLLSKSIENYNTYLTKKVNAPDKDKVNERINSLNNELRKYNISSNSSME